jgi:hypothetical protein
MNRRARLQVSDAALLRFLERAGALDVESLRAAIEISLKRAVAAAGVMNVAEFTVAADGLRYLVRDNVVVHVGGGARPLREGKRKR